MKLSVFFATCLGEYQIRFSLRDLTVTVRNHVEIAFFRPEALPEQGHFLIFYSGLFIDVNPVIKNRI